ncbi:MAG: acyl-CoA dehydrogenase family protein [Legionella sp.]|nr:acyl-CoA dehydrogenase family protein [Legionella sp.]
MTSLSTIMKLAESFETYLGNPFLKATPLNFEQILLLDEEETLPRAHIEFIRQWGYMEYLIPHQFGGKMQSLMDMYALTRCLSRRDLTTAITLGITVLSSLPVWIAGSKEQKIAEATRIKKGLIGCLALTEEAHGSDLTANEVFAEPYEGGWRLSGKKWCVNYATLTNHATVLCRTHPSGGALGFSLFRVDKTAVKTGIHHLPKLLTTGVRGLDISGFVLDKVIVPEDALIGQKKGGLEVTYKALQVSRTLCASFSLGAADTALRLALKFSLERHLYGESVYAIPAVKQRLAENFIYLLIGDCMALAMARACTVIPRRMSFWSAIVKFFIPKLSEAIIDECGTVIGARAYLRTTEWAIFQKIKRDNQVVGLFDGSSQVNLFIIVGNLVSQAKMRKAHQIDAKALLKAIFDLNEPIPDFTGEKLGVFNSGQDEIISALWSLKSTKIKPLVTRVIEEVVKLDNEILKRQEQSRFDKRGLAEFRLAEKYCWLFAASCVLQSSVYNQENLPVALKNSEWLTLAIELILSKLNANNAINPLFQNAMADCLTTFYDQKMMFSLLPIIIKG